MKNKIYVLIAVLFASMGCESTSKHQSIWVERSPLGEGLETFRPSDVVEEPSSTKFQELTGVISLRDVLAAAMLQSPDLAAAGYEVRAREAEMIQARLSPNPELGIEFENFGGSNEFDGTDALETNITMGHLIELGGKRMKRSRVAWHESNIASWEYEIRRIDVLSNTTADFVGVLSSERQLQISKESFKLARSVFNAVKMRIEAGKVPLVELAKAQVERSRTELELAQASRSYETAKLRLAANWGSAAPEFDSVSGDFDNVESLPDIDLLLDAIEQSPDTQRWAAEIAFRNAEVELALAGRSSDVTASFGARRFNDIEETVFVVGLSFPLQTSDRNEGNIKAAQFRALQAGRLEKAARIKTRTAVTDAFITIDGAFISVQTIRDKIVPSAELAFEAAEEAFHIGKIDALNLFDSQRTLLETRHQLLDAISTYHLAVIAGERLIGLPLHNEEQMKGTNE